jgi:hypothetical protein
MGHASGPADISDAGFCISILCEDFASNTQQTFPCNGFLFHTAFYGSLLRHEEIRFYLTLRRNVYTLSYNVKYNNNH